MNISPAAIPAVHPASPAAIPAVHPASPSSGKAAPTGDAAEGSFESLLPADAPNALPGGAEGESDDAGTDADATESPLDQANLNALMCAFLAQPLVSTLPDVPAPPLNLPSENGMGSGREPVSASDGVTQQAAPPSQTTGSAQAAVGQPPELPLAVTPVGSTAPAGQAARGASSVVPASQEVEPSVGEAVPPAAGWSRPAAAPDEGRPALTPNQHRDGLEALARAAGAGEGITRVTVASAREARAQPAAGWSAPTMAGEEPRELKAEQIRDGVATLVVETVNSSDRLPAASDEEAMTYPTTGWNRAAVGPGEEQPTVTVDQVRDGLAAPTFGAEIIRVTSAGRAQVTSPENIARPGMAAPELPGKLNGGAIENAPVFAAPADATVAVPAAQEVPAASFATTPAERPMRGETAGADPAAPLEPTPFSSPVITDDPQGGMASAPGNIERGTDVAKAGREMYENAFQTPTASPTGQAAGLNIPVAPLGNEASLPAVESNVSVRAEDKGRVNKTRASIDARTVRGVATASNSMARASVASFGDEQPRQSGGELANRNRSEAGEGKTGLGNAEQFPAPAPGNAGAVAHMSNAAAPNFTPVTPKPMTPAAILDEVGMGLERLQQRGSERVDLRVSLEGGGQVNIELQVRDGAVHVSFLTGSAELRTALEHGWSNLANRSESLGLPLAEPVFKAPSTGSPDAGSQDFRERRHEPPQERQAPAASYPTTNLPARRGLPKAAVRTATSALNAWA